MGYRFMARLRHYYTVHWSFAADKDGDRGRRERDASGIETYMVFGLEKTVEFRWGLKGRKLRYEPAKATGRDGEEGHEGATGREEGAGERGGGLCFGPRTRDYCRDNEAKARFLPFQPRARRNDISND